MSTRRETVHLLGREVDHRPADEMAKEAAARIEALRRHVGESRAMLRALAGFSESAACDAAREYRRAE